MARTLEDHFQHLDRVRRRTGMYVNPTTFDSLAAYVSGYDHALDGALLVGFKEWLVMRVGSGSNLAWTALARELVFAQAAEPWNYNPNADEDKAAVDALFELIAQFAAGRGDDPSHILTRYQEWCRRRGLRP